MERDDRNALTGVCRLSAALHVISRFAWPDALIQDGGLWQDERANVGSAGLWEERSFRDFK